MDLVTGGFQACNPPTQKPVLHYFVSPSATMVWNFWSVTEGACLVFALKEKMLVNIFHCSCQQAVSWESSIRSKLSKEPFLFAFSHFPSFLPGFQPNKSRSEYISCYSEKHPRTQLIERTEWNPFKRRNMSSGMSHPSPDVSRLVFPKSGFSLFVSADDRSKPSLPSVVRTPINFGETLRLIWILWISLRFQS